MSNRSGHYSEHTLHHYQHDHARAALRRPAASQASVSSPSQAAEAGYTLVHAGKQVRFGPVVFWIVVGTVTMLGMWSAATATDRTPGGDAIRLRRPHRRTARQG